MRPPVRCSQKGNSPSTVENLSLMQFGIVRHRKCLRKLSLPSDVEEQFKNDDILANEATEAV